MGAVPGWRGRVRSGASSWVASRSLREYGLGASLVVLLVSGAFGGLDDTRDAPPARVATGTAVDAAPFRVTVERVRVGRDLGVSSVTVPRGRYLLVSARVRTDGQASVPYGTLKDLVRLEGATGLVPPNHDAGDPLPPPGEVPPGMILSTDDAESIGDLAPGLTYPVIFFFEQEPAAPTPASVTVVLDAHTFRKSSLEETQGWFDPLPAVRVAAPVTPFVPAPEPSGGDG